MINNQEFFPLFIGGVQRSGTSLLRGIIGSHSKIAIYQWDLSLWTKYYPIYKAKKPNKTNFKSLIQDIFNDKKITNCDLDLDINKLLQVVETTNEVKSFKDIYSLFLEYYRETIGREYIGLKTPFNEYYVDDIFEAFPKSRFIHIIRSPMDSGTSLKKIKDTSWGGRTDYLNHIYQWEKSACFAKRNQEKYDRQYFVLKYEDLIVKPEETVKKICKFLNIGYEKEMLKMNNHLGWKGDNSSFSSKNDASKIFSNSINRYKQFLSKKDVQKYKILLGSYLEDFDYSIEDSNSSFSLINYKFKLAKAYYKSIDWLILFVQRSIFYRLLKKII